jgi:hypothetical protein
MTDRITREELAEWQRDAEYWNGVATAGKSSGRGGADERILRLIALIHDYEKSITWNTTCLNCSNLLDKLYVADMRLEQVAGALDRIKKYDSIQSGGYGQASQDAVKLIRDALAVVDRG